MTRDVPSGGRESRSTGEFREKMRKYQNHREPSYDTVSLRESSVSMDGSGYTKSVTTSMENLSRVMEATNSSGSENSSVSNVSVEPITLTNSIDNTRALLKKKSLVQIINNYIKAGIEEGTAHLSFSGSTFSEGIGVKLVSHAAIDEFLLSARGILIQIPSAVLLQASESLAY